MVEFKSWFEYNKPKQEAIQLPDGDYIKKYKFHIETPTKEEYRKLWEGKN